MIGTPNSANGFQEACECQRTSQPTLPERAIIPAACETGEDGVKFKARFGY